MVHAAASKCSEKNSATCSKNQDYLKVHDAVPSSDGQSICKVKRGCENRDALVKVKSSDTHNKTHQTLYEINAVSEEKNCYKSLSEYFTPLQVFEFNPGLSTGAREDKKSKTE